MFACNCFSWFVGVESHSLKPKIIFNHHGSASRTKIQERGWLMKPNRYRHVFPQLLYVCFSAFSFCLPCWPFVWSQIKWWPGRLCVASSCDWLLVLSTDGDRCCKWRGTFCLCFVSEVPLCHEGQ